MDELNRKFQALPPVSLLEGTDTHGKAALAVNHLFLQALDGGNHLLLVPKADAVALFQSLPELSEWHDALAALKKKGSVRPGTGMVHLKTFSQFQRSPRYDDSCVVWAAETAPPKLVDAVKQTIRRVWLVTAQDTQHQDWMDGFDGAGRASLHAAPPLHQEQLALAGHKPESYFAPGLA